MDMFRRLPLNFLDFEIERDRSPRFEEPDQLALAQFLGGILQLLPVLLLHLHHVAPIPQIHAAYRLLEEGLSEHFPTRVALVHQVVFLEAIESDHLDHFLAPFECHLLQVIFRQHFFGILFEASERLLKQFLRVIGDYNRFVRVNGALLVCLFGAACALLSLLDLSEGESRQLAG